MHDRQWVRIGLAFVLASTSLVAASVAGCGDDNGPGAMTNDGGNDSTVIQPDTGTGPDTGSGGDTGTTNGDGEAAAPMNNAHVFVVHASEKAPPLRFCYGAATGNPADGGSSHVLTTFNADPSTAAAGLPFPGVFPGTGGLLDDHGVDLSSFSIAAYAIDATKIMGDTADSGPDGAAAERNCAQLVGSDGLGSAGTGGGQLALGTDFWLLGVIPKGILAKGTSWVFAITGCPAGVAADAGAAFCGMGYDPASSNLGFTEFQLDSTSTAASDKLGAQLVHASQAWDAVKAGVSAMLGGGVISAAAFYEPLEGGAPPGDSGAQDTGTVADTGSADTGSVDTGAGDDGGDGGGDATVGTDASTDSGGGTEAGGTDASMPPAVKTVLLSLDPAFGSVTPAMSLAIPGLTFDGTSGLAMSFAKGTTPVGQPAAFPLPIIQQLTYGQTGGVPFANGMTFAFVLVGDPTQPPLTNPLTGVPCAAPSATCTFNFQSVHFLAFPAANN
jgi:hypothetical protein